MSWRSWEKESCHGLQQKLITVPRSAEGRGLSNLLTEFGYAPQLPIKIHTDNKGAQVIIENNASWGRTRYIDVRYHFVLDFYMLGNSTFPALVLSSTIKVLGPREVAELSILSAAMRLA